MFHPNVAEGVHRVEDANTNWYLVEGDDGLTVVDAGVPTSWSSFQDALAAIGRGPGDVRAVVLTHAHFDHVGIADRLRRELGVPVYVHEDDVPLTRHPWHYDFERPRTFYFATQIQALPIVAGFVKSRAFWPSPIKQVVRYGDAGTLPVPGAPQILHTPGHTIGHCALHLAERDVVIAGDALVMLDPYTARPGPRLVARGGDGRRGARPADARRDRRHGREHGADRPRRAMVRGRGAGRGAGAGGRAA